MIFLKYPKRRNFLKFAAVSGAAALP
ncbi:twin-arginine translocation signal domain-containing protein, partial [uncultured Campylobacter sp.]